MACPHVTGVAALVISGGTYHPMDARAILIASATDLGDPGFDNWYGNGLVDALQALSVEPPPPPPLPAYGSLSGYVFGWLQPPTAERVDKYWQGYVFV